jgi:ATP-binding cassette subfamily B protein
VNNWSRVLAYFRPELPRVGLALGCMLLGIVANVLKPWPVALIIDNLVGGKPLPSWLPNAVASLDTARLLGIAALLILLFHIAQGLFSAGQNYLSIKAGLHGLSRMRNELFAWMQRLSIAFYQRRNQGDLIYRATWDTYSLQTIFQQGVFKFLSSLATVVLMVVVMWRINVALTLITLMVFPPLLAAMFFFGRQMNRRSLAAHQADSRVASLVQQNIASLPVIQSYTREPHEAAAFGQEVNEALSKRLSQHGVEVIYWLTIALLFGIATAGLTWWGAREILAQRLTVGELVIFLSYLGQLYEPLNQLSHVGATVSDANAGLHRVFEILDAKETVAERPDATGFPPGGAGISFDDVTFGYDSAKPVLQKLSLEINPGEAIGLVGPSGAGKTTLLNLLSRFYDPDCGRILIRGADIKTYRLRELRSKIACVFQESLLLPGTVAENIAYGNPEASRASIQEAAQLANAHDFIQRLPRGYDTPVGEAGARLSVGEKQRINIARAFLKNAPILLLDEPTSALDAETETQVVESLNRLVANRTTIMAAHRVSTLRQATRIIVLENGRITETGTPAELLARNSYFARVASQAIGRI